MIKRAAMAVVLAAVFATLGSSVAAAADSIDLGRLKASITTDTVVVGPTTRRVNATVSLTAGPRRIAVGVDSLAPKFTSMVNGKLVSERESLHFVRVVSTTGQYEQLYSGGGYGDARSCQGNIPGAETDGGVGMVIPARGTVTLTFAFDVAGDAPWFDTSYAPGVRLVPQRRFTNQNDEDEYGPSRPADSTTIKRRIDLTAPSPLVTRQFAAKIEMTTEPAPFKPPKKHPRYVFYAPSETLIKPGAPVEFVGQLLPPQPGKLIQVRLNGFVFRSGKKLAEKVLGPVVTDASGKFRISGWTPPALGYYGAEAEYPEQPGALAAGKACAINISAARTF